jgi:agmatinase
LRKRNVEHDTLFYAVASFLHLLIGREEWLGGTRKMSELDRKFQSTGLYNFSINDYAKARVVLLGAPMDYTVSFKTGSRFGPQAIRGASYGLEDYSPYLDRHLSSVPFFDQGDLVMALGNVEKSLSLIYQGVSRIVRDGKIPVVLGGDHLISYPVIKAMAEVYPDLHVLHFDAHTDLRDTFYGEKFSHATVMRRVAEMLGKRRVYQYGIRSGEREEFAYADEMTCMRRYEVFPAILRDLEHLKGKPLYITFDIDCIDPGFCPGTGTPEPGGITTGEALKTIHALRDLHVVAMDLVEVSPTLDPSGATEIAAAKLIREAIASFWWMTSQAEAECGTHFASLSSTEKLL